MTDSRFFRAFVGTAVTIMLSMIAVFLYEAGGMLWALPTCVILVWWLWKCYTTMLWSA